MRFVDEGAERLLRQLQHLRRLDVLDQREFRRRQRREGEAATSGAHHDALAFGRERHVRALGDRSQDVEQFTPRYRDLTRCRHRECDRADELYLEVGACDAQAVVLCAQEHIGQHRHRLTPFDDTDHVLDRTEDLFTGGCEFHSFRSGLYPDVIAIVEPVDMGRTPEKPLNSVPWTLYAAGTSRARPVHSLWVDCE